MGDSACLMPSFSYPSGIPTEPNSQGNHVHALGDSVSFGRFMSESLAWEKWSTFSNKRYVEEAKSYAQPGSVAQKKAFFEAHYKRIAAQKAAAAALLEQEKAATFTNTSSPEVPVADEASGPNHSRSHVSETTVMPDSCGSPTRMSDSHDPPTEVLKSYDGQTPAMNTQVVVKEEQQIMIQGASKVIDADGSSATYAVELENEQIERSATSKNTESLCNVENTEDQVSVSEDSRTSQMEKPLLKSKLDTDEEVSQPMIKKKPAIPSLRSSVCRKPSRIPPSPAKSVTSLHPRKEKLMNRSRIPPSPAKLVASVHPRKENMVTPRTKTTTTVNSMDERRTAPKSLYSVINSSSVREHCKLTSPVVRKTENMRPAPSAHTTPRRCATPKRTPNKTFTNGAYKRPLETPSENRRMETPLHPSAAGSKTTAPKWHILSAVSKSLSAYRNKLQSPTISSPFTLRTEERATRRKQKLEEKFNEKEAPKLLQQTTLKEKAGTEFRKLSQSLCFKARPLPDFYKERETANSQIKTPQANPKSRTPGIKPPSEISRPSISTTRKSSRRLWKKNDQNPTHHPLSSLAEMISHENISPNIQQ